MDKKGLIHSLILVATRELSAARRGGRKTEGEKHKERAHSLQPQLTQTLETLLILHQRVDTELSLLANLIMASNKSINAADTSILLILLFGLLLPSMLVSGQNTTSPSSTGNSTAFSATPTQSSTFTTTGSTASTNMSGSSATNTTQSTITTTMSGGSSTTITTFGSTPQSNSSTSASTTSTSTAVSSAMSQYNSTMATASMATSSGSGSWNSSSGMTATMASGSSGMLCFTE
ncbi:hypothetical protein LDENG_00094250 [Lucifuga dentata]|nr:hypothetical protein LDENG_00094250 [Lucifuga dentata]